MQGLRQCRTQTSSSGRSRSVQSRVHGEHLLAAKLSVGSRPVAGLRHASIGHSRFNTVASSATPAVPAETATPYNLDETTTSAQPSSEPYDWHAHWYPVAFEDDIDKKTPYRFTLLNIPLVIWWDPNASAWKVLEDICPHRLVPLSEGRINQRGLLECGYHGWEFSGSGKCEHIPQVCLIPMHGRYSLFQHCC